MALALIKSGRPKGSLCWQYFKYDAVTDVSKCFVAVDGAECGKAIKGKNTTNLKRHLEASHKVEFDKVGCFILSKIMNSFIFTLYFAQFLPLH